MFVYQRTLSQGMPIGSKERFFVGTERTNLHCTANKVLVVASSLMFGGVSKLVALPAMAFVSTILVLAWVFADGADAEEPGWVNQLSLAITGLFYFGLGHLLGALALAGVGLLFWNRERL